MSEYRINVRFNLSDTEHTAIIDYLNSLDKEKYKSRNQFIIDAIKSAIAYEEKQTADDELLQKFRDQKNSKESDKAANTNIGRNLSKQNS